MKKLESLVLALSLFSLLAYPCGKTVAIAADTDSLASDEVLSASISDNNRSLEEVYSLLKQFISDQKDNGNHAFYLANVYESSYFSDNNGDIPTEFQNKIVLEYFWEDEETVLTAVKAFMQENGIDESLVAYEFLVDAVESDSDPESLDKSLKNAYILLKQFVSDQKVNGNHAFYLANVYESSYFSDNNGDIPTEFQNKIVLEYFWEDEETVLTAVKAFMQENDIDESLVAYEFLVDAAEPEEKMNLEEISDLLTSFIEQRGYDAHTEIHREMDNGERENTVSVVFHQRSIGEEPYDYDSLTADVNAFLAEKQIDTDTFDLRIEVQDEAAEPDVKPSLEEIRDLLTGYIEQRGYKARAEVADEFENTVTVVFEQLPIGAENYDFDALTADFNAFFAEKQIDTDSFGFLVLADEGGAVEPEEKMNLEEIRDLLAGYIEQRGYKARAEVADEFENTVTVVFEQLPIGAENYDFDALTADFNAFFAEKQIDTDSFGFLVLADEGGAKVQTDRITDEQLLNWVKIDYEKKLGIAVYPEIVSKSDSAYEFAVKDKEGNVLDTYMIDPRTGTGINASGEEVNLPQTGMSSLHKAFAGLAALMGITGIGLVKRSRKEDDE